MGLVEASRMGGVPEDPEPGAVEALPEKMLRHGAEQSPPRPAALDPAQQIERRDLPREPQRQQLLGALAPAIAETRGVAGFIQRQKGRGGRIVVGEISAPAFGPFQRVERGESLGRHHLRISLAPARDMNLRDGPRVLDPCPSDPDGHAGELGAARRQVQCAKVLPSAPRVLWARSGS
jgi:hypothetical protein